MSKLSKVALSQIIMRFNLTSKELNMHATVLQHVQMYRIVPLIGGVQWP